ncbi:hypothetical protein [Parvularcula sp. IMCC14364]|uniref:hypothetical protein n=1 Tax=Parvularcula sp. IMCC14364 TaxID=3067902 RepID=UPI0027412522|nr:hypothetical protein [Parvularcula sp. IMCC14364]
MEKQSLKIATRRWIRGHVFLWMIYAVLVAIVVPRIIDQPTFENWPFLMQLSIAILPVLPVAVWLYVAGRFVSRSPDELGALNNLKATATAGCITAIAVFAAGWVELILKTGPFSAWIFVALFGLTWMLQLGRLAVMNR